MNNFLKVNMHANSRQTSDVQHGKTYKFVMLLLFSVSQLMYHNEKIVKEQQRLHGTVRDSDYFFLKPKSN